MEWTWKAFSPQNVSPHNFGLKIDLDLNKYPRKEKDWLHKIIIVRFMKWWPRCILEYQSRHDSWCYWNTVILIDWVHFSTHFSLDENIDESVVRRKCKRDRRLGRWRTSIFFAFWCFHKFEFGVFEDIKNSLCAGKLWSWNCLEIETWISCNGIPLS